MTSNKGVHHVVSITVYGAKGLKPKKDRHKFCVIFGIGNSKYRTDIVEDLFDNPVFNKEAEITVDSLDLDLKFKVTEKNEKDVLGQVIVPLYELGDQNMSSPHNVPLRPHRKCPTPHGVLIFEAWVTEKKAEKTPSRSASLENLKSVKSMGISSGLKKLRERMSISGKSSDEKSRKSPSESLFSLKSRGAVSYQDITRESHFHIPAGRHSLHSEVPAEQTDALDTVFELVPKRNSLYLGKVSEFSGPRPEISSISPKSGPASGGTVVTIRGSNLGQNQDDIVALNICGSDVLATLEYISPWKLQCETLPWNPCVGSISLETLSGGRGVSLVEFAFDEVLQRPPITSDSSSRLSQVLLSSITEEGRVEVSADSNSDTKEFGLAVPYSDDQTQSRFQVNEPDKHKPCLGLNDNNGDDDDGTPIVFNLTTVSLESLSKDRADDIDVDELTSEAEFNRTKGLERNGSNHREISQGQDASDRKTPTASNGMPAKLPPRVVEIQPMRMEDKNVGSLQRNGSDGIPPNKPARPFPDQRTSDQDILDGKKQSSNFHQRIDQDDVHNEKKSESVNEQIRDLEMQLLKKTDEIENLVRAKKSLMDENWRLKEYIEVLVMRAIKLCPEVLCVDDSSVV